LRIRSEDKRTEAILGSAEVFRIGSKPVKVYFKKSHVSLQTTGIYDLNLKWERKVGGTWQTIGREKVKLYVVTDSPDNPWSNGKRSPNNVWTDVLDKDCEWAKGAKTWQEAGAEICNALYNLGRTLPPKFIYDTERAQTHYCKGDSVSFESGKGEIDVFDLSRFLADVNSPRVANVHVNCADCAYATSTFGRAAGCQFTPVWFTNTHTSTYLLAHDRLRLIGNLAPINSFGKHCVAWAWPYDDAGTIYDACVGTKSRGVFQATCGLPWKEYKVKLAQDPTDFTIIWVDTIYNFHGPTSFSFRGPVRR
jgi:hypothetical protein